MARRLPPLTSLRAFEAAGRHLSFTKAAVELTVTQAAVSHQVKALEDYLAQPTGDRGPIESEAFASVPLSQAGAEQAAVMLWEDKAAIVEQERAAEHEAKVITLDDLSLRYDFTVFGDEPADGRSCASPS